MSKQNGGEGGVIINMSSLAGKNNSYLNRKVFLLVMWTTKVNLWNLWISRQDCIESIFVCILNDFLDFSAHNTEKLNNISATSFQSYLYCDVALVYVFVCACVFSVIVFQRLFYYFQIEKHVKKNFWQNENY